MNQTIERTSSILGVGFSGDTMNEFSTALGVDIERLRHESEKERFEKRFRGNGNYNEVPSQVHARERDLTRCICVAVCGPFGVDVGHLGSVDHYVSEAARIAVDFFYGEYLKDEKWARNQEKSAENEFLHWFEVYRDGLLMSFLAKDLDAEKKLVDWIEPWLPFDESSYLLTRYDNDYHKLLAEYLKTGNIISVDLQEGIANSKKKRPRELLACLQAIRDRDEAALGKHAKDYLTWFLKTDGFGRRITTYFSVEGSLLREVAQRAGMELVGLNDKQTALIMTRRTLGLE